MPKHVIGVNMIKFYKMIKGMDKEDSLTMYVDSDKPDTLCMELESVKSHGDKKKGPQSDIKLSLLDLDEDDYEIPPTDFEARIIMSLNTFSKKCKDLQSIADLVEIQCTPTCMTLKCKDSSDSHEIKFPYDTDSQDDNDVIIEFSKKAKTKTAIVQGIYELKHLVCFSKCISFCLDIEIFMKNDYPLVIRFMVASLGRLYLCLTPIKAKGAEDVELEDDFEDEDEYYDEAIISMKE